MDINQKITEELGVKLWQVEAAVKLIDEGNTIPFIARYRKEATGTLDDEQLRKLYERLVYLRNLEEKKEQVLASIEEQGKLTEELKKQILEAQTQVVVEDLYRPYRPKRRTRATIAKEKGLEPLSTLIMLQKTKESLEEVAKQYIKKKAWQMYRKRWKVPEILSLRIFPMRRIIEAGSGSRRCRKDISFPVQKTRRQSLFMRIIMNSMSR